MNQTKSSTARSGAFLIFGTIVVLITIIMLGGDKKFFSSSGTLHVEFPQVQGLNMGAVISLAGLPIGNVSGLSYNSETGNVDIEMKIHKKDFSNLVEGTEAEIRTQGALGDKFIYLIPGPVGNKPITSGSKIQPAKSLDIINIISERSGEAGKIFDIINQIHVITRTLSEDNKLGRILNNLDEGSTTLKRVASQTEQSFVKFDRVITKVDKAEGTLGALIADPTIHDQIKTMLGGSQRKSNVRSLLKKSVELKD